MRRNRVLRNLICIYHPDARINRAECKADQRESFQCEGKEFHPSGAKTDEHNKALSGVESHERRHPISQAL